jgi:hypothetical protein
MALDAYQYWLKELRAEEKAHKKFRARARKCVNRYKAESDKEESTAKSSFNIFWSNVEVLHSAVLSNTPKPDVAQRWKTSDPASREVSQLLENAIAFSIDNYDFDAELSPSVDDYLIAGLGQVRVHYKPYFEKSGVDKIPVTEAIDDLGEVYEYRSDDGKSFDITQVLSDPDIGHYTEGDPIEEKVYEETDCEDIPWSRFRWQPCKAWADCNWAAIDHYMTKSDLKEQFEIDEGSLNLIPATYRSEDGDGSAGKNSGVDDGKSRTLVHEIFDKKRRKIVFIVQGYDTPLKSKSNPEGDDPLKLSGFYPFPQPLMATTLSEKFIPIPDFVFYQDQADEIDRLSDRIEKLTEELKYRGVYDSSFEELGGITSAADGEFVPVAEFTKRFEGNIGLDAAIKTMPLDELMTVITALIAARDQAKQVVYEITGIADIVRGSTKASETLGAQQLKGQFANMRLARRQKGVARFVRDVFRIKAEIVAEHFDPETLELMTGVTVTPEMMQIMRSDVLRAYKIDVESDSTVIADAAEEQKNRTEALTAITALWEKLAPAVQSGMMPIEVAKELMLFGVRGYKGGRQLEEIIEKLTAPGNGAAPGNPPMGGAQAGNNVLPMRNVGGMPV